MAISTTKKGSDPIFNVIIDGVKTDAIVYSCRWMQHMNEFAHLIKYGYAPGHYMNRCCDCQEMSYEVDKRAILCLPCAQLRYDRDSRALQETT